MPFSIHRELRNALKTENRIDLGEAKRIIDTAKDGGSVSFVEKWYLNFVMDHYGDRMDADAKTALQNFISGKTETETPATETTAPPTTPAAEGEPGGPQITSHANDVQDLNGLASAFTKDFTSQRDAISAGGQDQAEKKTFGLFEEYGARLVALAAGASADDVSRARTELMQAFEKTGFEQLGRVDTDGDKLSDGQEVLYGTDRTLVDTDKDGMGDGFEVEHKFNPTDSQKTLTADHKPWTTTYWPMAGDGNADGNADSHLWAKDGALDKLDDLRRARGDEADAKALEFERKPSLNWLVGNRDTGHYIPEGTITERDAERTTGVDFNGDGRITADVKADFLNARGDFAAVGRISEFVPKLGDEVLTRRVVTADDGTKTVEYRKADGSVLSPADAAKVVLTNPRSDGKADNTMDVTWWGSCDKVALGGILFETPKRDVELDGVKFTKQDILGLLTVVANSQAKGTDFVGARYDDRPDILVTKDGRQLTGKIVNFSDEEFRTKDMWRQDGDYMTLKSAAKDVEFRTMDGKTETIKAADIKSLAREDQEDMSPMSFHTTMLQWLGVDKRPAAMDRDQGPHVWNYNFHTMEFSGMAELTEKPSKPGFHGPAGDGKIFSYDAGVKFGDSDSVGKRFSYWIEYDKSGAPVNGGWTSENADFLWRPSEFRNWTGANPRNPYVTPELVKEIYTKSIE